MRLGARVRSGFGFAAALVLACALAGCATSIDQMNANQSHSAQFIADHLPNAVGGEPANVPARSASPQPYPSVYDRPAPHDKKLLTDEQEKRTEAELAAARNSTTSRVSATAAAEKKRAAETAALEAARARTAEQAGGTTSN